MREDGALPPVAAAARAGRPRAPRRAPAAGGHAGADAPGRVAYRELEGPGRCASASARRMAGRWRRPCCKGASGRLGRAVARLSDLGEDNFLCLPPEEQYLVATGRTYFRDLAFDDLHRLQFDLETTGLNAARDAIFLVAVRDNRGTGARAGCSESGRAARKRRRT